MPQPLAAEAPRFEALAEPSPSPAPVEPEPEDPHEPCEEDEDACCPGDNGTSCFPCEPEGTGPEEEGCCDDDASEGPVRYLNGELQFSVTDLSAGGFGGLLQHRRIYSNRLTASADVGNGYNWLIETWPYLVEHADGSITVVRGTRGALWFDSVNGDYVGRYGALSTLVHEPGNQRFVLTLPAGPQYRFHDFDQTEFPPGRFAARMARGGQLTKVTAYTDDQRIEQIEQTAGSGGSEITRAFRYTYHAQGPIESVTLRQRTGGGDWTDIRRATYDYYGADEDFGSFGDLKRVRIQDPEGQGWGDIDVHYYRYYKQGDPNGFAHGLKFVLGPEPYARMIEDGLEPLAEPDAVLAQYAEQYLKYDIDKRVVSESLDGGSRTFGFAYTASTHSDGYNHWKAKTVETRPDGSEHVVYTNYIGQILIKELRSGSDRWIEYRRYDHQGRRIERANPSAVIGYDDSQADLDVALSSDAGLIQVREY